MLMACFALGATGLADTPHASLSYVKKHKAHSATHHKAHKVTKHKAPKHTT